MIFMTRLDSDSMQINRHEGFSDQSSKKHKKRGPETPLPFRPVKLWEEAVGITVPRILSQM